MKDRSGAYRVFYYIKLETAVVILHAFQKKTAKTPPHEIELARARLKEMRMRQGQNPSPHSGRQHKAHGESASHGYAR